MKLERTSKYYKLRLKRLRGKPQALAGGFAIGVFIGITPTIPLHTIVIIMATLATRTSTIAGLLSSWVVCNPLTYFPIYFFSMKVGNAITPYELSWQKIQAALDILIAGDSITASIQAIVGLGYEAVAVLLVGGIILALPFTLIAYYSSLYFFITIRKKRLEKQVLN